MKANLYILQCALLAFTLPVQGQGAFVYDQQSITIVEGAAPIGPTYQPVGQSFIPTLSSVGFVELYLYEGDVLSSVGGTVYVNLRSESINGTIQGSTSAISLPDNFVGIVTFLFSTPVLLTPGMTYYLQPVIQSGSAGFASYVTDGSYLGGAEIIQGVTIPDRDLWFREGIVVPEPSSLTLFFLACALVVRRRLLGCGLFLSRRLHFLQ
jgi:hypothetical protein